MADPHKLQRFVDAQSGIYEQVVRELADGHKQTHWMWFAFPQLRGLGHTATAQHYGIGSLTEAQAYLAHPVLGPRLRECTALLRDLPGQRPVSQILGSTDALKLRSCLTLFIEASSDPADRDLFEAVLARYYGGEHDQRTRAMLTAG